MYLGVMNRVIRILFLQATEILCLSGPQSYVS